MPIADERQGGAETASRLVVGGQAGRARRPPAARRAPVAIDFVACPPVVIGETVEVVGPEFLAVCASRARRRRRPRLGVRRRLPPG